MGEKVAIVTGGSRGIGKAVVEKFAGAGIKVYFTYANSEDSAAKLAGECGATAIRCPQNDSEKIAETVDKIYAENGAIDILVNNAGITRDNFLMLMPKPSWREVIETNLNGAYEWTKCVAKKMYARKSGSIIFISSVSGLVGVAGQTNYAASKGAICAFSRACAAELGAKSIRVNTICPGFIDTDIQSGIDRQLADNIINNLSIRRLGTPEEVAKVILFLASDQASYVNGQVIRIDGGM
mgnify:CR=1 FL=1